MRVARKCGVYKIVCKTTGKQYFGSTRNWKKRQYQHRRLLRIGKHHSIHLQRSWNKYGENDFEFVWLENVAEPFLEIIEQKYLDNEKNKLNIAIFADSGPAGRPCSEQRRQNVIYSSRKKQLNSKSYRFDKTRNRWLVVFRIGGKGNKIVLCFDKESDASEWANRIRKLIASGATYSGSAEQAEYRSRKLAERVTRTVAKNKQGSKYYHLTRTGKYAVYFPLNGKAQHQVF